MAAGLVLTEPALAVVARLLTRGDARPGELGRQEPLGGGRRSTVVRVETGSEWIVVKQHHAALGRFNPGDMTEYGPAERFWNEVVGLDYLPGVPGCAATTPRLIGADAATGLLVVEDLGRAPTVACVLAGDDPTTAEAALVAWARTLGRLHGATSGGLLAYETRWANRAGRPTPRRRGIRLLRAAWARVILLARGLGLVAPSRLERDIVVALGEAVRPGPFLVYSPGDPCPDNHLIGPAGTTLVDLEYGGFRHALLDGAFTLLPFPTCRSIGEMPGPVQARVGAAFRLALAGGCEAATDDVVYARAMAACCVALVGHTVAGRTADEPALAIACLDALVTACADATAFESLASFAADMASRLRQRCPDPLLVHPAFRPVATSDREAGFGR